MSEQRQRIIDYLSRLFSTDTGPEFRGVIFRRGSATGRTFTRVSAAGPTVACGSGCSIAWQPMRITNTRCSTAPLSAPISTAPGRQKKADEQAIGRSRGGLSTKIHALVDALGNPLAFYLTGGQAHDLDGADALLPAMTADTLLADKADDADERVLKRLDEAGKTAVIPPKANRIDPRDYDKDTYKARHLIENFFCKLKLYRAIATRYDKTARNFLAAIHLAAAIVWLN